MTVTRGPWAAQPQNQSWIEEFQPFSPAQAWATRQAPRLDWLVNGAVLRGSVAILAGDGGLGKSLLLQQLMTAACKGIPWLGMATAPCRSLAVFCEDDPDELHRRQERINAHYGLRMTDLEGMMIESRPGRDCVLMQFRQWGGDGRRMSMFGQLEYAAKTHGAKIVVLDTVADVFSGNEIDRVQARVFIRALRKLALEIQGCVILTQHPSNEGLSSGSGRSGSTGWHNSVRCRMYLTEPKDKGEGGNRRTLKTMKANYSARNKPLDLIWDKGVFVVEEDPYSFDWKE